MVQQLVDMAYESDDPVNKCIALHLDIVRHGVSLVGHLGKLGSLARDAATRVQKDSKLWVFSGILKCANSLLTSKQVLLELALVHCPTVPDPVSENVGAANVNQLMDEAAKAASEMEAAAAANEGGAEADTLPAAEAESKADDEAADGGAGLMADIDILALLPLPPSGSPTATGDDVADQHLDAAPPQDTEKAAASRTEFYSLDLLKHDVWSIESWAFFESKLHEELFVDVFLQHLCVSKQKILDACMVAKKALCSVSPPDKSWKQGLSQDASLSDVMAKAGATLLKLPVKGQALLKVVDDLHQARRSMSMLDRQRNTDLFVSQHFDGVWAMSSLSARFLEGVFVAPTNLGNSGSLRLQLFPMTPFLAILARVLQESSLIYVRVLSRKCGKGSLKTFKPRACFLWCALATVSFEIRKQKFLVSEARPQDL